MNENIKNVTINQLANMLFIPQELIQSLMVKHNLVEKRKRIFFFADFLFVCFWCLFHGVTRHQDRKSFMKRLFNADVHALYRVRWQIEEMFREIKQAFGGDRLRLRNENSVVNHIYMMLISYLVCKCFLRIIATVNHKSPSGFMLDTCMKGSLRHDFLSIVFHLIKNLLITNQQLHNISKYFCECGYSPHRANSSRKSRLNRVMRKLEVPSNE